MTAAEAESFRIAAEQMWEYRHMMEAVAQQAAYEKHRPAHLAAIQASSDLPGSWPPDAVLSFLEDMNKESVFFFYLSSLQTERSAVQVLWCRKNSGVRQHIRTLARDSWLVKRLDLEHATGWHAAEYDYVQAMAVAEKMGGA